MEDQMLGTNYQEGKQKETAAFDPILIFYLTCFVAF